MKALLLLQSSSQEDPKLLHFSYFQICVIIVAFDFLLKLQLIVGHFTLSCTYVPVHIIHRPYFNHIRKCIFFRLSLLNKQTFNFDTNKQTFNFDTNKRTLTGWDIAFLLLVSVYYYITTYYPRSTDKKKKAKKKISVTRKQGSFLSDSIVYMSIKCEQKLKVLYFASKNKS